MSMPDFTASVTGVLSHTSDNLACWAASRDSDNVTLRSILFPAAPSARTSDTVTVPIFQPFRSAYMRSVMEVQEPTLASMPPAHDEIGRAHVNSSHGYISYAVFCLKKKKK